MTQNLTELAQAAIDALNAYTAERNRKYKEWSESRYSKGFKANSFGISDEQEIELLTAIIDYDDDAAGTLQEMLWQVESDPRENEADYRYEEMRSRELLEEMR
jgi:hypothetical protein